jgi:hypothetical protein
VKGGGRGSYCLEVWGVFSWGVGGMLYWGKVVLLPL